MAETNEDRDVVLNPDAIGNPDLTPVVQLSAASAAYFERTRCKHCGLINYLHEDDCPTRCTCECSPPEFGGNLPDRECPFHGESA